MNKINFVVSFLLLIAFTTVKSQTIQQLGYYSINGVHAMSSKTNFMILGDGSIINISNPAFPNLTGNISLNGFSTSVLVNGNYAYYGTGMNVKLIIADISNPSFPLQIGAKYFPQSNGGIFGLAKNNNILYLAMGGDGVYSVDITNNANPFVLDSIVIPNGQARDIITKANYAYVAHYDGLKIIDISNPANLNIIASVGSGYNSIDINNNFVFLGKNSGGVDVFNISNPFAPIPVFSIPNINGTAWDIKYSNNLIYLTTDNLGLFIYKIVNNSGIEIANFPNTNNGQSFAVSVQDSLILLSGLINGVAILKYDSLGTVGINDRTQIDQLIIFPNPANNYIEFNQSNENISEIEITNINGVSVLKALCKNTTNRIDISNLPKGNYIVNFKNKKKIWQKKLIKVE